MTQTLNGTAGNDPITGTNPGDAGNPDGIDIINGLAGNDTLFGLGGDDVIQGGLGDDIIQGGLGADNMDGGDGYDTLTFADATSDVAVLLNGAGFRGEALVDTMDAFEAFIG
ncbi:calcium-binding protein, partial [Rhizobiaceae sp. 2RAB30]